MPTGYEIQMYQDIHRIALALEQIVAELKRINGTDKPQPAKETDGS